MDRGKSGEMKMESREPQLPGLESRLLTRGEFLEHAGKFRVTGKYNALDTSLNERAEGSGAKRKRELGQISKSMKEPGESDVLFEATDGDEVVGFLAIKKTPHGKKAQIRQLWTAHSGKAQRKIIASLLTTAKTFLVDHGYSKLAAEPVSESHNFSVVTGGHGLARYMRISRPEVPEESLDIDIEPEEIEMPEGAANEDAPPRAKTTIVTGDWEVPEAANEDRRLDRAA